MKRSRIKARRGEYVYAHPADESRVDPTALQLGARVIFDRFCPIGRVYETMEPLWDPDTDGWEGDL